MQTQRHPPLVYHDMKFSAFSKFQAKHTVHLLNLVEPAPRPCLKGIPFIAFSIFDSDSALSAGP